MSAHSHRRVASRLAIVALVLIAIVLGLVVYVIFGFWLHPILIGVPAIVTT